MQTIGSRMREQGERTVQSCCPTYMIRLLLGISLGPECSAEPLGLLWGHSGQIHPREVHIEHWIRMILWCYEFRCTSTVCHIIKLSRTGPCCLCHIVRGFSSNLPLRYHIATKEDVCSCSLRQVIRRKGQSCNTAVSKEISARQLHES